MRCHDGARVCRVANLPGPEEIVLQDTEAVSMTSKPISLLSAYLKRIHARKSELLNAGLHRVIPRLIVSPLIAASLRRPRPAGVITFVPCSEVHTVHPETAIVNRITELASACHTKGAHRGVLIGRPCSAGIGRTRLVPFGGLPVETKVGVEIEGRAVRLVKVSGPVAQTHETVMEGDERSIAFADAASFTDNVVSLQVARDRRQISFYQRDS